MTTAEAMVLAGGLVVILGGLAWTYRYTLSPKAEDRMAAANLRYRPPRPIDEFDWALAAKIFAIVLAIRLVLLFLDIRWWWFVSPALWTIAIMWVLARRKKRRSLD